MSDNILVVDDDELVLYGLKKAFKQHSFNVVTASSASIALEMLNACPFKLCLLDIHLPDFNGLELMRIIRDMFPSTKVIIMTASFINCDDLSENITRAIENGACHFIAKPFNLCEIIDLVKLTLMEDAAFLTGFSFCWNFFVNQKGKGKRNVPRKRISRALRFFITVIEEGGTKRLPLHGKAIDISEEGVGMVTKHPLWESQIIGFDKCLEHKTGVVVWSTQLDDEHYRAGIRFA